MNPPAWRQVNVAFRNWERAEITALAKLAPLLRAPEDEGTLIAWFIVRKQPCWRVRYQPTADGQDRIGHGLDVLTAEGYIKGWTEIIYEPEVHAFGGTEAMASAHHLFHRDSRSIIDFLQSEAGHYRRETSLMLCSLMMRSAGLDWYEQGDVWARVAAHRSVRSGAETHGRDQLHTAVRRLLSVDPQYAMRPGGPLARPAGWARAYTDAGRELADLTDSGQLHRGLRDVLAHHVIFAWNRIGLPYATQATLTAAAKTVIFGPDPTAERRAADHVETP
ncbi:thiopeptide-type bacteriocin biosynthesis protein [Streptomyces sp. NPDC056672]|uniref:thiopeptide-type bacteriocin biosynthesis protein n=1 Tax=Streptomyces sp. NPDC056672 TaxID=3345906 RepID=UPI00368D65D0